MITDLIEYGKWLSKNNLDDFGKVTKDEDYIFLINFDNGSFIVDKLYLKKDFKSEKLFDKFFKNSIFSEDFLISTDQRFMIPSKSNLLGLSPFFIKLDHDFLKKGEIDINKIKKFQNKVNRSIKANANKKEFVSVLSTIYNDSENFIKDCPFDKEKIDNINDLFSKNSIESLSNIIIDYYTSILNNLEVITSSIIDLKKSEKFNKKSKPNFYLACCFNNEFDLINDLFVYYSKIFKKRDEKVNDFEEGICSFCGEHSITYSSLGSYALSKLGSFNFSDNMENSRLRMCKKCNSYLRIAEDNLKKSLNGPMMIIPKSKGIYEYDSFIKISNLEDKNSFSKINEFLKDNSNEFNYDLVFYKEGNGNTYVINKYVENYQAFLIDFNKKIRLYDDGLHYLFGEKYFDDFDEDKIFVNNLFDLESIFKSFFISIEDDKIKFLNLYNFYNIYTRDLNGSAGILYGFDSKTTSIFTKYMHSIFSYIYELNDDALDRYMVNEIVLNLLLKFQKNTSSKKNYKFTILKNLNYYFMLRVLSIN